MLFEIHATDNGPVIIHNSEFVVLTSEDSLIQLIQEDVNRFDLIEDHIKQEIKNTFDLYLEGFAAGINPPAGRLYAYIAAYQQFWMFKYIKFPNFLMALENSENE
jgi:hypothetical protein